MADRVISLTTTPTPRCQLRRLHIERRHLRSELCEQLGRNHSHRLWHRARSGNQRGVSGACVQRFRRISESRWAWSTPPAPLLLRHSCRRENFSRLYGSGLAPTTNSASVPFPTNLSGVQVLINQIPAPIYYVSPTQISVIVPYITTQVSGADPSDQQRREFQHRHAFTGETSVGVFTNNPVGGIGIAAARTPRLFGRVGVQPGARLARPSRSMWREWAR